MDYGSGPALDERTVAAGGGKLDPGNGARVPYRRERPGTSRCLGGQRLRLSAKIPRGTALGPADNRPAPCHRVPGLGVPCLFVSGTTPRSARAIQNIRALCEERLHGRYELEVIDIYQHPEQVKPEQIVVTPTLVKKLPLPFRKIIGDLSDKERVLIGLDMVARDVPEQPPEDDHGA